jgi:hypothetical protein
LLLRLLGRRSFLWLGLRLVNFDDFLVQTSGVATSPFGLDEMMG